MLLACIYPIFDPGKVLIVLQFILSLFIEKMLSDCTVYSVCLSVNSELNENECILIPYEIFMLVVLR